MKYIISESQYRILLESKISLWVRRRVNVEYLRKYILEGKREYPNLCEFFEKPIDYSEAVIEYAVDEFMNENYNSLEEGDSYPDTIDYLKSFCRIHFRQELKDIFIEICLLHYDYRSS